MKLEDFSQGANTRPPNRLGQRYDHQHFLPDPGNTVVCHLDLDTAGGAAVLRARRRMQALPEAERLLFTPEDSLHMTVFEGVLDARRTADAWPADIARDAEVAEVTAAMCQRLAAFDAPASFAVSVDTVRLGGLELRGATPADETALLEWREALSRAFGYRQAAHDTYQHHMTFAYMLDWLPDSVLADWKQGLADIQAELQAAAPVLPLRAPAFCTFNDMTWFEELLPLA
ncbi:DUF1868 domain-containing protein [Gymnodinialimonas sp. 57CJ19]|uniref:DUF1868 domain-containing protein n=1 Tax=Gymnodinialimonas sp. 57CJ19 TaxID=3138498 RepID=UPI00313449C1